MEITAVAERQTQQSVELTAYCSEDQNKNKSERAELRREGGSREEERVDDDDDDDVKGLIALGFCSSLAHDEEWLLP